MICLSLNNSDFHSKSVIEFICIYFIDKLFIIVSKINVIVGNILMLKNDTIDKKNIICLCFQIMECHEMYFK